MQSFDSGLSDSESQLHEHGNGSQAFERDFGNLVRGSCRAVVRPRSTEEVADLVRAARNEGTRLTPRAGGRSQSGQSVPLDGVSFDTSALNNVGEANDGFVRCGAGASFAQLHHALSRCSAMPLVAPMNPALSVGGVLSAGGFGSTSHQNGLVVSTVEELEVVLGTGEIVQLQSANRNEVWDAVLGGVGQFGVITSATLKCKRVLPWVRTFRFRYSDIDRFLEDQVRLQQCDACTHLEGFCWNRPVSADRSASAAGMQRRQWSYEICAGFEWNTTPPSADEIRSSWQLGFETSATHSDSEVREHALRYASRFEAIEGLQAKNMCFPWIEVFASLNAVSSEVPKVLEALPASIGEGHRLSVVDTARIPRFLAIPEGRPAFAFALLPLGVPQADLSPTLGALRAVHDRLLKAGGKRYLSGWLFQPSEVDWKSHFGADYQPWQTVKRQLDPDTVLTSVLR